ncbi:Protein of unknown function [Mameliella alba]|uniref:DUF2478 domain-containing protein n=1 Tax=Mameliella alba TaxID=561184 RepID=UPI00088573B6|nr:DUF2478 domain-containing protein [Mameliella alba]OWV44700.1 3-dehydroquinate dehydratase [Mameliella alba]PTR36562.1 uncharacterized protein DUF2478 [Mameliella alba]GGF78833.1 hypothetical protein GCM10011319_43790 [Mameliella alba]SDC76811.1 Protein of unknown function [Mameliella alba]
MTQIATLIMPGRGDTDELLYAFAQQMLARGYKVRGLVQINTEREGDHPCDMDVQALPDGPVFRISQNLGSASRGCRLDPENLELSVAAVETSLAAGADLIVLNKFGKQEAAGRGFRDVLARAVADDIPVVVGLNAMNEQAFEDFAGGLADRCDPSIEALTSWALKALDASEDMVA